MSTQSYLVGSDEVIRAELACALASEGFEILKSCADSSQMDQEHFDQEFLAIIDFPNFEDQIEAVKTIKALYPSSHVVVLSPAFEWEAMTQCFELGAHAYILRTLTSSALIASLRVAAWGEKVMPPKVLEAPDRHLPSPPSAGEAQSAIEAAKLSQRELDVLCCMMEGDSNKIIARRLDVCEATVKVHVKSILRKLHLLNGTQAAIWAKQHGLNEICH